MKQLLLIVTTFSLITSCKQNEALEKTAITSSEEIITKSYPEEMSAIFKAHGGIEKWNEMNNLCFTLPKGEVNEIHTVDLKSRKTRIETEDYVLGFDTEGVWVQQDTAAFNTERARFYHNLMFYFYAMPFVLGDDGITYEDAPALEKDGITYPGTKISFGSGVGDAPDDNYIVYKDPTTNQMAWLAYTVTYGGDGPSERYSYIKYAGWQDVNGLKLPSELQWYNVEDGQPTEMRNAMNFIKPTASTAILDENLFKKPETLEYIQ